MCGFIGEIQSLAELSEGGLGLFDNLLHLGVVEIFLHEPELVVLLVLGKGNFLENVSSEGSVEIDYLLVRASEDHSLEPVLLHPAVEHRDLLDLVQVLQLRDPVLRPPTRVHVLALLEGVEVHGFDELLALPLQLPEQFDLRLLGVLLAQPLVLLQLHVQGGPHDLLVVHVDLVQPDLGIVSEHPHPGLRFDVFPHLFGEELDEDFFVEVC